MSAAPSPEQFALIEDLFERALELSVADRDRLIESEIEDPFVREEVMKLLESDAQTIEQLEFDRVLRFPGDRLSGPEPRRIGTYTIVRVLGSGGFGVVYLAIQAEPVRRQVALKVIKPGMDSEVVIARFEGERQALAMMDHPNVAGILDAGATDRGLPYFVMEYVAGVSLTQYCDDNRLSTEDRLDLFLQVCDGVQHAHQRGIIHRDINPANILVSIRGGRPVPRIIDFGIAKALQGQFGDGAMMTQAGQLIGTPEYMSPEQAAAADVDTRTDIYSLGVLLYELLSGVRPFSLASVARLEIQRVICEEDPARPSTRLSEMGDGSVVIASKRRTDTRALTRRLRGDLDWITMRAMEKELDRRYPSASEFAADVRRHLDDEAVEAGRRAGSIGLAG